MITWLLEALRRGGIRVEPAYLNEGEAFLLKLLGQFGRGRGIAFREGQLQKDLDGLVDKCLAERVGHYCGITDAGLSRLRSNSTGGPTPGAQQDFDAAPRLRQRRRTHTFTEARNNRKGQTMSRTLRSFTSAGMPADTTFTAEIVEHTPDSRYASCLERTILVITDHNEPDTRSVTNAIEDVLLLCRERFGLHLPGLAIYRDTTGVWDGVRHFEGTFRGFFPIGETDRDRAIDKALGREPGSVSPNRAHQPREPR